MQHFRGANSKYGLPKFSKQGWIKCVCVRECDALYEAVILSILAALKQSDNPGIVNPWTAAQALSAILTAHRNALNSTLTQHVGGYFIKQNSF